MANDSPIQFKGTTLKIIQVHLRTLDLATLHAALEALTGNTADFFDHEPAVLDFRPVHVLPDDVDWPPLLDLLRRSGLTPVAACGLPAMLRDAAATAGLPTLEAEALPGARAARVRGEAEASSEAPQPSAPPPPPEIPADDAPKPTPRSITLDKPLRSGQRFYAKDGDLIVTAMVSAGAEVIADGNIHVYAPLRGRALAGAGGDRSARIFTTCLEAELVSVAGFYRTFDGGVPADLARQPATVSLRDGDGAGEPVLAIAPLSLR